MTNSDHAPASLLLSAFLRSTAFFGFWLVLTDAQAADVPAGIVAAIAATWASLRLMPQQHWSVRPAKLAGLVLRFVCQSIVGGIDVARLALDPRRPLRPGFVIYHPLLSPGTKCETFCAITSLMPGTLPSGASEDGGLAVHCLDVTQPVVEQIAAEEALFVQTLGGTQGNG
jgi:multicomponent Na+:H+ antiporter subunit E